MKTQKDYERSVRRIKCAIYAREQAEHSLLACETSVMENLKSPSEVLSKKYLVVLLLFSFTCASLSAALLTVDQLQNKANALSRKPGQQQEAERILIVMQTHLRNVENQKLILNYRAGILLDILAGKEPDSRYT